MYSQEGPGTRFHVGTLMNGACTMCLRLARTLNSLIEHAKKLLDLSFDHVHGTLKRRESARLDLELTPHKGDAFGPNRLL